MEIHAAAARGDLDGIRFCLGRGVSVDARNHENNTPLIHALETRRAFDRRGGPVATPETLSLLLDAGADPNAHGHLERTPLHAAAAASFFEGVAMLVERGADPRREATSRFSTLVSACYAPPSTSKLRVLRRLADAGVSLDLASIHGESPLTVTAGFADFEAFRILVEWGADVSRLGGTAAHRIAALGTAEEVASLPPSIPLDVLDDGLRFPALFWAILRGDLRIVEALADRGASIQQRVRCGIWALQLAAEKDRTDVLAWLMAQGLDPEAPDEFGGTPLAAACAWDALGAVRILLDRGCRADVPNRVGMEAQHQARSLECLRLLAERKAIDLNRISGTGEWPLREAAGANDVARLRWLVAQGAEIDRTSTGETALHAAVRRDSREAVRFLLEAGADPNAADVDGWTPLFYAGSREVLNTLLRHGADPTRVDDTGAVARERLDDPLLKELL